MKLSILIPTHRRHGSLVTLLQSIGRQAFDFSELEVLIVTNLRDNFFSTPEFAQSVDGLSWRLLTLGELSVNKARNLGLREAKGEVSLLLDDDCELKAANFLSEVVSWHGRHPKAIAIGGGYVVSETASPLDRAYNCVARQWQALDHFGDYRSSRLVGGNVSYKTEMLKEANEWFDETIQFGGTEAEFHQRLNEKGLETLYIASLEVVHQTRLTVNSLIEKAVLQAQGHIKYNIDAGFSDKASRTYQNKRILLAREFSQDEKDFHETVHWINLYDWAYNYSCENPTASPRKVVYKSKNWQLKNRLAQKREARL